jgi:hypothetical protein
MIPLNAMRSPWAKMPCGWQTDPDKHELIVDMPTGAAIAALKLYLGLCCKANFNARNDLPAPGSARITLSELSALTGLSRPMVVAGIRALRDLDIVEVIEQRPAVYRVRDYESASYWTKLPLAHLYGSRPSPRLLKLADMSNRSSATLHALQLYLYLASIRDRRTFKATVSYSRLENVLHMSRNAISRGISMLVSHDLIGVRQGEIDPQTRLPSANVYWLIGRVGDTAENSLPRMDRARKERIDFF